MISRRAGESPSLSRLQEGLREVLTDPRGPSAFPWIAGGATIPARRRLKAYSDAYFFRLLASLGCDFASCRRILGERAFRGLVAGYLAAHPSRSANIADAGESLPAFIRERRPGSAPAFLADLALLEWTALRCVYSRRMSPLDPETVAGMGLDRWAAAKVTLDPTVHVLELEWPVHRLLSRPALRTIPGPRRTRLLVRRDGEGVRLRSLRRGEFEFLDRLGRGMSLGEACADLAETNVSRAGEWFADWTKSGLIRRVEFAGSPR